MKLGNKLVETTDDVMRLSKKFIGLLNRCFEYVEIKTFIFEESDYEEISYKEVMEIKDIFNAFGIQIKELTAFNKRGK
jgi:hypothetical protein